MTSAVEQLVNAVLDRNVSGDELEHVVVTTQTLQEIAAELQLHVRGLGVRILLDDRIKEPFQVVSKKQRLVMERLTGKAQP
jgi:hypothetical protein